MNFLNKLFKRDKPEQPKKEKPSAQQQQPAQKSSGPRHLDIPARFSVDLELKAIPERQPGKPRAWNVKIVKLDSEGIWVARTDADDEALSVEKDEILALVLFDDRKRLTYDCPVLRVTPGRIEQILVGPPTKTVQDESQIRTSGGRKHFRISFRLPAEVRQVVKDDLGPPVSCHTRDISMSGLAVESPQLFDPGSEIEIRVLSWNFPLKVRAFIVRCQPLDKGHVVAVSFPPDMSTISQDLIAQFILENQKSQGR